MLEQILDFSDGLENSISFFADGLQHLIFAMLHRLHKFSDLVWSARKIHAPGGSWWNHQMICIDTMAVPRPTACHFPRAPWSRHQGTYHLNRTALMELDLLFSSFCKYTQFYLPYFL